MANSFISTYNSITFGLKSFIGGLTGNQSGSKNPDKNLGATIIPIPLLRLVQSIQNWRASTIEAEYTIPFRVKQQQLYNDLIDEPHTAACMERRMDLTLLRDFEIIDANGKHNEELTKWLKESPWFIDYQRYILTAKFRGYVLVSLGNIVSNESMQNGLPQLKMIEHSVISPDRKNVASVIYVPTGQSWEEPEYRDWHVYADTPPEIGAGACGYGILQKIAVAILLLRANLSDNANYNEKFGQPITHGTTTKTDDERIDFFNQLKSMGAAGTFVTDPTDDIKIIEAAIGTGYKTFADLEMRCQKLVSKNILGHADVMDSIPKKSGSAEGNSATPTTPVQEALSNIKSKDGKYVQPFVNELLNKMRTHGVAIPQGATFRYKNDEEEEEVKRKDIDNKQKFATIAKTMKDAGLQIDPKVFTEYTDIPCTAAPQPVKVNPLSETTVNKLNKIYAR